MRLITIDPEIAWGSAVFSGTRVPVETMFVHLATGETLDEYLRQFPTVSREVAIAVLEEAQRLVTQAARDTDPAGQAQGPLEEQDG
jgi:uncharacterized protein (DUF433 family)